MVVGGVFRLEKCSNRVHFDTIHFPISKVNDDLSRHLYYPTTPYPIDDSVYCFAVGRQAMLDTIFSEIFIYLLNRRTLSASRLKGAAPYSQQT